MRYLLCMALSLAYMYSYAQDSLVVNSFESTYRQSQPSLKYSYNDATQTHGYSGNWDLDGDGKADSLYFTGNGGVHLYFSLNIVLSSDNKLRDYNFILLDMPVLGSKSAITV